MGGGWPLCEAIALLIPPYLVQFWEEKASSYGPIVSGGLFAAGWWIWGDAIALTSHKIPFVQVRGLLIPGGLRGDAGGRFIAAVSVYTAATTGP